MTQTANAEPQLAKPGAGLPFLEWAIAKYIILPYRFKQTSPQSALLAFTAESNTISSLVAPLNQDQMSERRLIPRLIGLEDSSRYWSVAMTLKHVTIVGNRMKGVIVGLSSGDPPTKPGSIADVKPPIDVDCTTIRAEFEQMSQDFVETVSNVDFDKFPNTKYAHPWFGAMTAKEWLFLATPHMEIHEKQIGEILKRI